MRIFTKSTCFSFIPNLFKNFALSVILSRAGFYKTKGLKVVTLFVEAISSIITAKTTYAYIRQGKTAEAESLFKSPFYRFLNNSSANWRSLQLQIAHKRQNLRNQTRKSASSLTIQQYRVTVANPWS